MFRPESDLFAKCLIVFDLAALLFPFSISIVHKQQLMFLKLLCKGSEKLF